MACKDDVWKIWHRPAGIFTLLLMLILNMVFAFTGWDALYILSFALAILSIFRIFSKNVSKRYEENQKFLQMTAPVRSFSLPRQPDCWICAPTGIFAARSASRRSACPEEKATSKSTCPKCRHEFVKKAKEQLPVFLPAAAEGQGVFAL